MEQTKRQILAARAEELRRNMTYCERLLWFGFLRGYEVPFRAQKVIGDYIVDFYCRKVRLSIEIDGDSHYNEKSIQYDEIRTMRLEMREIKELRFTNDDIKYRFNDVCELIHAVVQERRHDVRSLDFDKLKNKK